MKQQTKENIGIILIILIAAVAGTTVICVGFNLSKTRLSETSNPVVQKHYEAAKAFYSLSKMEYHFLARNIDDPKDSKLTPNYQIVVFHNSIQYPVTLNFSNGITAPNSEPKILITADYKRGYPVKTNVMLHNIEQIEVMP